ncbi:MAG: CoA transferase [Chloroflexota bacterium]|nr:CoA transferase [Dehalococcoidia bacterium]MDW8252904.1 CoA transferase [Chloroflexota bacterium]
MDGDPLPPLLAGLRVAAAGDRPALVAARLLADLGAACVVVEPPAGHPLRAQPPLTGGVGAVWWELTRGMEIVRGALADLDLSALDILIVTNEPPPAPDPVIVVRISPFGPSGPCAHWRGSELIVQAASGLLALVGDPDRPPVMIGGHPIESVAGAQAATAALIALIERDRSGRGQRVDVSQQAAAAWATHPTRPMWRLEGQRTSRAGCYRPFGAARRRLIFPCADGYVAVQGVLGREWPAFVAWATEEGMDDPRLRDPLLTEAAHRASVVPGGVDQATIDQVDDLIAPFLLRKTRRELYEEGQRRRIILFPVNTPADLLADPHLQARRFFAAAATPSGQTCLVPGTPVTIVSAGAAAAPQRADSSASTGALAGVRVLDFSWVGAGPLLTFQLAAHGAEVIRVESALRPDVLRLSPPYVRGEPNLETSGYFFPLNASKRSIALNLATAEGRAIARQLAARCDIVVDSFTPRVMPRWGLDHAALRRDHPDLIVLSLSMLGATGPHRDALGFGTVLQAAAGYPAVTGWPDRDPVATGVPFTDWIAPFAVLPTLLAALLQQRRAGRGYALDASQLEATLTLFREPLIAVQCAGAVERAGNRLLGGGVDLAVPHGVYRCRDEDCWIAIACLEEDDWTRLAAFIGSPPVPARAPLAVRREARLAIDDWLAQWCRSHDADAAAAALQEAGVPAAPVRDVVSAADDPQLRAWGFGTLLDHPAAGETPYDPPAFRLARTPAELRPAPLLGQHTEEVIRTLLALSDEEWERLVAAGVFV